MKEVVKAPIVAVMSKMATAPAGALSGLLLMVLEAVAKTTRML
jgi:hypothetical protein